MPRKRSAAPPEPAPPHEADAEPEATTGFPAVDRVIETARREARREVARILHELADAVGEGRK
jgi:hypothetical protein